MIEVEFIPVGDSKNTGDAILIHFIDSDRRDRVILIDGGFSDTCELIATHVQRYYKKSRIDLMICTHPDDDHINGLFGVFDRLEVGQLVIHQPSTYGYTSDEVKADKVDELVDLARRHGTEVTTDAFAGAGFFSDAVIIAGPTEAYYKELLSEQDSTPPSSNDVFSSLVAAGRSDKALIARATDPGEGELTDHGGVTARNNSSIVIDVQIDGARALFTGDAGEPALSRAADYLDSRGRTSDYPDFFDVPHHGSRHNLTTSIMDRLAGPIESAAKRGSAFVSVGRQADSFPRAEVANAFTRRGYRVSATRGKPIRWNRGAPKRDGWQPTAHLTWLEPDT